ncbi:ImmA/IrrE family metallo-endopeptidase [Patulibacter sp.]|uniref:ImmA/IrrE family metallo-endopeptidase n=1 Tax=Patulibacter sp. TaxID=1912859 RepID=UPI00272563E5|nr:ImmA/IrrE family metallo-endopeptidase [Patulibacter sp.]MDO9408349.1 ImmA/IrrE family metallo-endopeptidase [Patulibacter sp.]
MTVPGPPVLDIPDAVEAAREVRDRVGVDPHEPLPCVISLAEQELGLDVVVASLPENCSGFYLPRPGRGLVATNGIHAVVRQRFTVAHEVGHHVLGHGAAPRIVTLAETPSAVESPAGAVTGEAGARREDPASGPAAELAPATSATVPATPKRPSDPRERAANAFAAELLCPAPAARAFVDRHATTDRDGAPVVDFDLVVRLSCAFGLSAWAVLMRLGTAKVLEREGDVRAALQSRVDAQEHIDRYGQLGLLELQDELQEIAGIGRLPRLPEGVAGDVLLTVTDPDRPLGPLLPAVRQLRVLLGVDRDDRVA